MRDHTMLAALTRSVWPLALLLLVASFVDSRSLSGRDASPRTIGLHYLLPTTTTNPEVCKLLFTGAALGFPDPVLLGWEGRGRWNGTVSHLFKLAETLSYLEKLAPDHDDDLVLLLDAFDVWLQLPPQILIQRYVRAMDKEDQRLKDEGIFLRPAADGTPLKHTILFGADKLCWPLKGKYNPACWSAPPNAMPDGVFGPATYEQPLGDPPRFLNSGTMLGPVKDVRAYFAAVLDNLEVIWRNKPNEKHEVSDQYYLSIIWHEQEAAREALRQGKPSTGTMASNGAAVNRTEYHVAVDHESDAFLVNAWYSEYMTWMSYNHSTRSAGSAAKYYPGRLDRLRLPEDILASPGPFSAGIESDPLPIQHGWGDILLGTNTISGEPFPLYHITGLKQLRGWWWPRMWFHPYGAALLKAARRKRLTYAQSAEPHVVAEVANTRYTTVDASQGKEAESLRAIDNSNAKGGAWNDQGEYMLWDAMCLKHEEEVFLSGASAGMRRSAHIDDTVLS